MSHGGDGGNWLRNWVSQGVVAHIITIGAHLVFCMFIIMINLAHICIIITNMTIDIVPITATISQRWDWQCGRGLLCSSSWSTSPTSASSSPTSPSPTWSSRPPLLRDEIGSVGGAHQVFYVHHHSSWPTSPFHQHLHHHQHSHHHHGHHYSEMRLGVWEGAGGEIHSSARTRLVLIIIILSVEWMFNIF